MTRADLPPADLVLTGRFERSDEKGYRHVPFEVPRPLRQLHVRYAYSDMIDSDPSLTGGNTLDIGIFDERGTASGGRGFRGWSGSNKLELTIDERWATPPYRAGAIRQGTWHVLVGPYKVGPRGCDYRVEIWLDPGIPEPPRPAAAVRAPASAPAPPVRPGWLRGDLHCHTVFSDGDSTPAEMLLAAADAGLDFLGVTDHNNVAHHAAYGRGGDGLPIVVPGVEVTTYGGHWNAHGTDRWWEFREPSASAVEATMREAAAAGALVTVCHPKPLGPPWEYGRGGFHAVEVWNGDWLRLNAVALAFWEECLRRGQRITAVGGSDTHRLRGVDPRHEAAPGRPTTWVHVGEARTTAGILAALREGRSFVSASPRGPQLYLEAHPARGGYVHMQVVGGKGSALLLMSEAGCMSAAAVDAEDWEVSVAVPAGGRYVRAQLVDGSGVLLALSDPVWSERL